MNKRIESLRRELKNHELDAALIFKNENRRYISGFTGTSGYVVITQQASLFIADFRYIEQAKEQCKDFEVIEHNSEKTIYSILKSLEINSLGFEEDFVTYGQYREFQQNLQGISLLPLNGILNKLRRCKDDSELNTIQAAATIADEAFGYICDFIMPGVTERQISMELENQMRKKGATSSSFEIIVASGIRSSLPHGVASDKVVKKGDFVTLDFGCIFNGYCSDMTRTIVIGKANDKQKEIYRIVLEAQVKALEAIKPGITGQEADKVARDIIKNRGYGKYFGHGLGHGVGLEIHEAPRLSPTGTDILEVGMVVTDEPGIYIPDFGGVRIEDLIVVTEDGNRVLSKSPKELIEL